MAFRMLVADLDGTLLTSAGRVTPRTRDAIQGVHRSGVLVVLASARPPPAMRHIVEQIDITAPDLIAYSGAVVISPQVATAARHRVIDVRIHHEVAVLIFERALELGVTCWWYADDCWFLRERDDDSRYEAKLTRMVPRPIGHLSRLPPPHKLLSTCPRGEATHELQMLHDRAAKARCSPQFSNPHSLEIVAAGVNKGVALRRLAAGRGVSLKEVVAIGDGPNDREMMALAGCAVAMANSVPETIQVADFVTGSNDDDGVADAIERLGLNRPQIRSKPR